MQNRQKYVDFIIFSCCSVCPKILLLRDFLFVFDFDFAIVAYQSRHISDSIRQNGETPTRATSTNLIGLVIRIHIFDGR